MRVDFSAVEPSGKIAMRVLRRGPVASGFFWNAAQSEVICSAEDDVDSAAIRRSEREPIEASEHARPPLCHYVIAIKRTAKRCYDRIETQQDLYLRRLIWK
jgi:hypothetical protein